METDLNQLIRSGQSLVWADEINRELAAIQKKSRIKEAILSALRMNIWQALGMADGEVYCGDAGCFLVGKAVKYGADNVVFAACIVEVATIKVRAGIMVMRIGPAFPKCEPLHGLRPRQRADNEAKLLRWLAQIFPADSHDLAQERHDVERTKGVA